MVRAVIDSKIRIPINQLPNHSLGLLCNALEIPNEEKLKAEKMNQWGWRNLPDTIQLWDIDEHSDELIIPRGFQRNLILGLEVFEDYPAWNDRRTFTTHGRQLGHPITLRPYQTRQVASILHKQSGIVKAPAGSGKTVAVLACIQRLKCNALVIVNTKDILWQWQERIRDFMGDDVVIGQIGDNVFDVSPHITIATAQTIHSRYSDLEDAGFFENFSFVCLDESHHATAATYNRIVNSFSSVYRIGVSATPDKTGQFELATNVLGPIIHETTPDEVAQLTKPKVVRISTNFKFGFNGSGRNSNYQNLIKSLISDQERNQQIVQNIIDNQGHHQLVISKRLDHLEQISALLAEASFPDPVVTIIGDNTNRDRQDAKALAEEHPCVLLSTLADEAMDIARLDRLHLIYPQRNTGLITQQVGRVERVHPDKKDSIIFDYVDKNVDVLYSQFRGRRFEVYEPRGYQID